MTFEDSARIFHEPDCEGLIVSGFTADELRCSECGKIVGTVEPAVLGAITLLLSRVPPPEEEIHPHEAGLYQLFKERS